MTHDELQAALDAATATLESTGYDAREERHARDVLALAACVSALRDVLSQTERERDEARARIARYVAALDERHRHEFAGSGVAWHAERERLDDACGEALAALRETPAGEGER